METVHKTLDILETFLKQPGEIGIAELSALSGVNITTSHRIASDLVKRGYLKQRQKRGKYCIGTKLLEYQPVIQNNLKIGTIAQPYLQNISKQCGESVDLAILDSLEILTIGEISSDRNLRITATVGERMPLHASSLGKIFLAYMSEDERSQFYAGATLYPRTGKTVTDMKSLEQELGIVRKQGYSIDNEEYDVGVWAVSAPIFDSNKNVIASLAIVAPSVRIKDGKREELISLVKSSAFELSREMGYVQ